MCWRYALLGLLLVTTLSYAEPTIVPPVISKTKRLYDAHPKTTLTREMISNSGDATLAQLLQHQSNLQLHDTTGNGSQVLLGLRGFGANASSNTLLLINGVPITQPDIAPPNLNLIPLNDIESIDIVAASDSVIYGDQAVGGFINIQTRNDINHRSEMSCYAGSYQAKECAFAYAGNRKGWQYQLNVLANNTNNYRVHNAYDQQLITGRSTYHYSSGQLAFDFNIGQENMQYPGALTATEVRQNRRQANNDINFFKDGNGFFHLQLMHTLPTDWLLTTEASYRIMSGEGVLFSDFTQFRKTVFLKPSLKGSLHQTKIHSGFDVQRDQYRLNSLLGLTEDLQEKYGFYVFATQPLWQYQATIGARASQQNSHLFSDTTNNFINRAFVTTVGITYPLPFNTQTYLRRAGSFRFPKAEENASTPPGIHGLKTQIGASYEAGVARIENTWQINAYIYQLQLKDEIAFDPLQTPQDPFGTNTNLPPTIRRGLTLTGKAKLTSALTLDAAYDAVNARFQSGPTNGKRIPLVAEQMLKGGLLYEWLEPFKIYAQAIYTGNQYAANDNANVAGQLGGYITYNLNLQFIKKQLRLILAINNLFNKKFYLYSVYQPTLDETFFYPAPERNILLTFKYLFE